MSESRKHSLIGVTSCVIGITMFAAFVIVSVVYYLQFRGAAPVSQDDGVAILQLSIAMVLPLPVHAFGLILGAVALFFPTRKKLFPIVGVISNLTFGLASLFPWIYLGIGGMGRV